MEKKNLEEKAKRLLEEINRQRINAEKKGLNFTGLTIEQIHRKLKNENSPFITSQSWNSNWPGKSISYTVGIHNPDPYEQKYLFAHVFVGPGNIVADIGDALCTVDTRFPRLTLPEFDGLALNPDTTEYLEFSIKIPFEIEYGNLQIHFMGNCFLFKATWHDVGEYLDRGLFVFKVRSLGEVLIP